MATLFSDQPVLSRSSPALRLLAGAIAAVAWSALALQLRLILADVGMRGLRPVDGIVVFLVFFTTQANILVALATSLAAAGVSWPSDRFKTALAVYILGAGLIFALWLRPYYHHHGPQLLADVLLHYVTPPLYAMFWAVAVPKPAVRWRDPMLWMIYPAVYLLLALAFGVATGFYPYPIVNIPRLGFWPVALNVAGLGLIFAAIGVAIGAAVRRTARR